jgi:murein DD-endopeptidase MepM/ murein hydrolase activator NlpD
MLRRSRRLWWVLLSLAALQIHCADKPSSSGPPTLQWPVDGRVSSEFGARRGTRRHGGIDLRASVGTPIRAAGAGRVIGSQSLRGYGNVVIVDHGSSLETRYAHNRKNLVRRGQRVARGEVIAEVGQTGNATAPHLHFEVRWRGKPQDPRKWLPLRERR